MDEGIRHSDESGSDGGDDDDDGDGVECGNENNDDGSDDDGDGSYGDNGNNDEMTYVVSGSQRGGACHGIQIIVTQDIDYGGRSRISQQGRHLDRLVDLNSSNHYSSEHGNH